MNGGRMNAVAETTEPVSRKLRDACDQCHIRKVKCSGGGPPCKRCANNSQPCHYSLARRIGKPPGSKNKKTLERLGSLSYNVGVSNSRQNSRAGSSGTVAGISESSEEQDMELQDDQDGLTNELGTLASISQPSPGISRLSLPDEPQASQLAVPAFPSVMSNDNPMQMDDASFLTPIDLSMPDNVVDMDKPSYFDSTWLENGNWEHTITETPVLSSSNENSSSSVPLRGVRTQHGRPVSLSDVVAQLDEPAATNDLIVTTHNHQRFSCQCMRELTGTLCQLHAIEKRQNPVQVDTMLTCSSFVFRRSESYLKCLQCSDDTRTHMQAIMIFQTLFCWAQMHVHGEGLYPGLSVTLGRHELLGEETNFIISALISRALDRSENAVRMISSRVHRLIADRQERQTWSSGRPELQNLLQLSLSLCQTSEMLLKQFAARKAQAVLK